MEIVKSLQNQKILKFVLITILGSILLTISAKVKIPFYPAPMTMQTCVVLFLGMAFSLLWLGYLIGWDKQTFKLGAQPFLLAAII